MAVESALSKRPKIFLAIGIGGDGLCTFGELARRIAFHFCFQRNRFAARSKQVHLFLREHGAQPGGQLAPPMKIFEQGFPPAVRAGADAVQIRVERIRQFLGACVIGPARASKHRARCVAQILAEVSDEKLPGLLDSFAASARQREVFVVKRFKVGVNLAGHGLRGAESFRGGAAQALGKYFFRQSPARTHFRGAQLTGEMRVMREKLIERGEGGFFWHEFSRFQAF